MPFVNTTYKKIKRVNGKLKQNIFIHKTQNNQKMIVKGHYNKTPIYFRTNFNKTKSKSKTKRRR